MASPPPVAPAAPPWRARLARWPQALWLLPPLTVGLALARLREAPCPLGHDAHSHYLISASLDYLLRHQPAETLSFLRTNLVHWPPLVYVVTAALSRVHAGLWAYHATTLAFAAVFVTFLLALARRTAGPSEGALLAALAVCACPLWPTLAVSYNLETPLAAGVVFLIWAAFAAADRRSWFAVAALAVVGAAALLTKTVVFAFVLVPLTWAAARAVKEIRADRRRAGRTLLLIGGACALAACWHAPAMWRVADALRSDEYGLRTLQTEPWWFYLRALLLKSGAAPLLLGLALVARRTSWRGLPAEARAIGAAALFGLACLSAIGAKRSVYLFPVYVLLAVAAGAAIGAAEGRGARVVRRGLLAVYAALTLAVWLPAQPLAARVLSLGSATAPPAIHRADFAPATRVAEYLAALTGGQWTCQIAGVELADHVGLGDVDFLLALQSSPPALLNGFYAPSVDAAARLARACVLVAVEQPDAAGPGYDALAAPGAGLPAAKAAALRAAFDQTSGLWREVERWPLPDAAVAIYLNERAPRQTPAEGEQALFEFYYGRDHDPRLMLRECERDVRRGSFDEALRRFRLVLRYAPENPRGALCLAAALRRPPPSPEEVAAAERDRLVLAGLLFDYLAAREESREARALAEHEIALLSPAARPGAASAFVETARRRGQARLVEELGRWSSPAFGPTPGNL